MPRNPVGIEIAVQVYGWLIRAYPIAFRRRYGQEMIQLFREWATDQWQQRGWIGLVIVWYRGTIDWMYTVVRQHSFVLERRLKMSRLFSSLRKPSSDATIARRAALRRALIAIGVGFAIVNGILWFSTPALRTAVDASAGRLDSPHRPVIVSGVQELLVYYDPWLAWYVFPLAFTFGFASIPFLGARREQGSKGSTTSLAYICIASALLVCFELVWLFLIWVGVWCRGPDWNFYWPGENWDPTRVVALDRVNFSEYFWTQWFGVPTHDMSWLLRESPGVLLLITYFLLGFMLVAWIRWKKDRLWPLATATFLLQLGLAVPLKMFGKASIDLKYVVAIPEFLTNI